MTGGLLRCLATLAMALVLAICANQTCAQQMSFAVYSDVSASGDGSTIYNYGAAEDHSTGCSHWSYATTCRLYSPSGRNSAGMSSGLSSSTSLSFSEDSGNWTAVTQGTYNCSCIYGQTASFGSGISFYAGRFYGRYYYSGTLCPNGLRDYWNDSCNHQCMVPMICSSAEAPYLWDVGVSLGVGGWGACKHSLQGSNNRGLCQGP